MADRQDPFEEMDHIKAVPMEQAVSEHRETMKAFVAIGEEVISKRKAYQAAQVEYQRLEKAVQEKTWQLSLSALEE